MANLKRFLSKCFIWFCGLGLASVLFCFFGLKPVVTSMLEMSWDVDIRIGAVRADFAQSQLVLESINVGQPYGFPRGDMAVINKVEIPFKGARLKGLTVLTGPVSIEIGKIDLMRRVSGHLNLEEWLKNPASKRKVLKILPSETLLSVAAVQEEDLTGPLLQKKEFNLKKNQFRIGAKRSFREILRAFAAELLASIEEQAKPAPAMPAPQYKGVVSVMEESLREQSEKISKENEDFVPAQETAPAL